MVGYIAGLFLCLKNMSDKKVSQLNELILPADSDIIPIISDAAGSPVTKKITVANMRTSMDSSGKGGESAMVASSTAPATIKARADYLCDGSADQTEINTALAVYKSVVLSEGTFNLSGSILVNDGNWLQGQGKNTTILQVGNGMNASAIAPIGTTNIYFGKIAGLKINGNKANNTSGHGIYAAYFHTWTIQDCHINESADSGVKFYGNGSNFSINNQLMNCRIENTTNQCVFIGDYAPNNQVLSCIIGGTDNFYCMEIANTEAIIRGNHVHSSDSHGVYIVGEEGVFVGNIVESNGANGVYLDSHYWTVTGNKVRNNGTSATGSGIKVIGDRNTITGNTCVDLQGTPTQVYGIELVSGADNNMVAGNNFYGNTTGEYIDGGANNIIIETSPVAAEGDSFIDAVLFG